MERPNLPFVGPEREFRLIATTTSLAEANTVSEQYELQGYETKITRKMRAGISLYQVWIAKPPDILQGSVGAGPASGPRRKEAGSKAKPPRVRSK